MTVDVVKAEIIRNRLVAIADEMAKTLILTAYNPILYESQDFSTIIMSSDGDMWAETPGTMVFNQSFPDVIRDGKRRLNNKFAPGDVLIVNDPFVTGTHISDTNIYMPVFDGDQLVAFCGTVAHWADIGGKNPGGWCPDTTDMYQEGLCFRHQKLIAAGEKNQSLWDFIDNNVRVPTIVHGDLEAQIAACRQGVARVQEMCAKFGRDALAASMAYVIVETDRAMCRLVATLPEGEHHASLTLDSDGVSESEDLTVSLTTKVKGGRIVFSLAGSSPQALGPVNLPGPGTRGILASAVKGLLMPFDPCNAGHTMCIDFELPEASIINPDRPAPTDSYGYLLVNLMELVFRCMTGVVPERCPSGGYQLINGMPSRTQPGLGKPFIMMDAIHGGNGATFDGDGPTNQLVGNGDLPNTPVEILESRYPVLVNTFSLTTETAGAGAFMGGKGVSKDFLFLEDGYNITLVVENTKDVTAKGVMGGADGKPGYFVLNPGCDNEEKITRRQFGLGPFQRGTVLRIVSGGGGGWGPPKERDDALVEKDLRNDFITPDEARRVYGTDLRHSA